MYTSALEYHIAVLQGLQKVAAYTDDMFTSEEIDFHLTKQQNRLVEEIVTKRFEDVQSGLDYIRPLIVKNKALQVFLPQTGEAIYESGMVYGVLPPRYLYLITDRSGVLTSTDPTICADLRKFKKDSAYQDTYTEYIAALPMVTSAATQAPYYYNFKMILTKNGSPVTLSTPAGLQNIQSAKSGFYVSNYVLQNFDFTGVSIYWEYYREKYYPNCFVLVTTDSTITKVDITTTKSSTDTSSGGSSTAVFSGTAYTIPKYGSIPNQDIEYNSNTLTEGDDIYTQNANVFYQSKAASPKSTVANQLLMVYESKSFLISNLVVDFVRIPRQISLSLNQISELGGNAPDIIVDRTVEYLKLAIENPAYQAVLNDNKTRDQI